MNPDQIILQDTLSEIRQASDSILMGHPGAAMEHLRAASKRIHDHLKDAGVEVVS